MFANAVTILQEAGAGGGAMEGLVSSMTSGFATMASDALSAIGSIMPVVLPVMGGIIVVGIGIKIAKKMTKG